MDILNYAAVQRHHDAMLCNTTLRVGSSGGVNTAFSIASQPSAGPLTPSPTIALFNCWNTLCQCLLVCKVSSASGFKVCDTTGYYRCGACCLWTVPAGVTFAQFQLWGPGSGAGAACCCGGSFFGPTGAYTVVGIPVTAGATYTICAGCAYCCFPCNAATVGLCGGPSYVTGTNLTGVCADSGISCMTYYNAAQSSSTSTSCCVWYSNVYESYPSPGCICSCTGTWEFCHGTSTTSAANYSFSACSLPHGSVSGTGSYAFGIPGMYPKWTLSNGLSGSTTAAPVFGFTTSSMCSFSFNGNSCVGCCYAGNVGYMQLPGQGGYASSAFGGCIYMTGDAGRMGMVCVTYC